MLYIFRGAFFVDRREKASTAHALEDSEHKLISGEKYAFVASVSHAFCMAGFSMSLSRNLSAYHKKNASKTKLQHNSANLVRPCAKYL